MDTKAITSALVLATSVTSLHAVSNDGDLLSDVWELTYGFSTVNGVFPADELAAADPDGDGRSNLAESLAGTDPNESQPFLLGATQAPGSFSSLTTGIESSGLNISWWGLNGKYYRVEVIDDLVTGTWDFVLGDFDAPLIFEGGDAATSFAINRAVNFTSLDRGFARVEAFDLNNFSTTLTDWEFLQFTQNFIISDLNDSDGDSVNDNEDAAPFDASVGRVDVSISAPANGSTIQ